MNDLGQRVSARAWRRRTAAALMALAISIGMPAVVTAQGASASPLASPATAPVPLGDTSVQYVAAIGDSGVYVAVVDLGAGIVNVYLCDGADLGLWFQGTGADGAYQATAADGATVAGTLVGATATGSVTLADGTTMTFTAPRAELPAGLYQRSAVQNGEPVQARTIVLPDGTAKGKKGHFSCSGSEKAYQRAREDENSASPGSAAQVSAGNVAEWYREQSITAGCAWSVNI